jgi:hypothetical protein
VAPSGPQPHLSALGPTVPQQAASVGGWKAHGAWATGVFCPAASTRQREEGMARALSLPPTRAGWGGGLGLLPAPGEARKGANSGGPGSQARPLFSWLPCVHTLLPLPSLSRCLPAKRLFALVPMVCWNRRNVHLKVTFPYTRDPCPS